MNSIIIFNVDDQELSFILLPYQ